MKRWSILLVAILLFSLSACVPFGKLPAEPSSLVEEKVEVSQNSQATPLDTEHLVTDGLFEILRDETDGTACEYHIPKINLEADKADAVNQKMMTDGMAWLNQAKAEQADQASMIHMNYGYSWWYHDGVVSVLATGQYPAGGLLDYYVYAVSTESGKQLSHDELRQRHHLSQGELTDLLRRKASGYFQQAYGSVIEDSFYTEQYNKTVAEANLNQSSLFINDVGDLCSVTTVYALAGADSYARVLNLTGTTPTDFFKEKEPS